jgi:hypothetical protein
MSRHRVDESDHRKHNGHQVDAGARRAEDVLRCRRF